MDVTLGVSVAGADARIALLDASPPHTVIDQSELDLTGETIKTLALTLVSTDRMLTEGGHRLVATRVCSSDTEQAAELTAALVDADLSDVSVVEQPDAMSAVARSLSLGGTVASLIVDGDTAALSIVDADSDTTSLIAVEPIHDGGRAAAYRTLLERFNEEPGGATSVIVMGSADTDDWTTELAETTPVPLRFLDAPEFAVARGAALAGFRTQPAAQNLSSHSDIELDAVETVLGPQVQQLAYSQVDDPGDDVLGTADVPMQTPMRPLSAIDPDEVEAGEDTAPARPRVLLLGSTVAAIVIVGFAALAVSVAISIRPTASEQAIRMQQETVPGKYFPVAPGQGVNKDGENWTMVEQVPPAGIDTGVRTFQAKPLNLSRAAADTVAPRVIEVFRDGTVGVQGVTGITPPVPPVGGGPVIPDFVPRLIPDFSKVNMCQVLSFVGNLQTISERAVNDTVIPLSDVVNPVDGLSLKDLGVVAAVPSTRGELFRTDPAAKVLPGAKDTIPAEIFQTSKNELNPAQVLPSDTALIQGLPTPIDTGKSGSTSIFGEAIPDLGAVNATQGTAKPTLGEMPSKTTGTLPEFKPTESLPGLSPTEPKQGGLPDVLPGLDPTAPKQTVPLPGIEGSTPKPDKSLLPDLGGSQLPLPPSFTPPKPPIFTAPKPIVEPEPPIFTPPKPAIVDPAPPIFTPPKPPIVEPEPIVIPDVPVQAPKPIIDLPLPKIFPVPAAPANPAPVEQAPAAPVIPQLPDIPMLPKLGGLFGSGQS
ncbi:hypothetical protein [Mycolicibacterium fortuitum]|uniref:hypothetical protein n=1 Tax=Mycolicibacterium fortuitum TaxID=1766 RepID=UPI003AAECE2C